MKRSYTIIPDWMLDLDLDIWETVILATIFGFSQDGESLFHGSWTYLQRKAKCSRDKVSKSLKHLAELGYIKKIDHNYNGLRFCEYFAVLGSTPDVPPVRGTYRGSTPGVPNNIDENIDIERYNNRGKFQKPTVQEVADYCRARNNGIDAEEFVAFYESKGWMVGRNVMRDWKAAVITWEKSKKKESRPIRTNARKESLVEHYRRVDKELEEILNGRSVDNQ